MDRQKGKRNIVIVDDEPLALYGATGEVRSTFGWANVMGFDNAMEALEYAKEFTVDVALLDIEMPYGGVVLGHEL